MGTDQESETKDAAETEPVGEEAGAGRPSEAGEPAPVLPKKAIIVVTNQKGGVGKTTTASALIDGLRRFYGLKVLGVDADPQANLTRLQQPAIVEGSVDTKDWLLGLDVKLTEDGQATIPSDSDQRDLEAGGYVTDKDDKPVTYASIVRRVHETMDAHGFDVAVIDTHPDMSLVTMGVIAAATHIIIPSPAEMLGIDGVVQEFALVEGIGQQIGANWERRVGVVITLYQQNTFMHRDYGDQLADSCTNAGYHCFKHRISRRIQIPMQQASGSSLFDVSVKRGAIAEYAWLCDDVVRWVRATADDYDFDDYFRGFGQE